MKNEKAKVKIIPLGGVNEIGKNLTAIEYKNDIVVIDCGLKFPDEDMFELIDNEVELAAIEEAYNTIFMDEE